MAGLTLNLNATLQCPHGGRVQILTSNARVKTGGAYSVTSADTFTVIGCPFSTPAGPMPCLTVQWAAADMAADDGGQSGLSQGSVGLAKNGAGAPQGPVLFVSTQPSVQTR